MLTILEVTGEINHSENMYKYNIVEIIHNDNINNNILNITYTQLILR